jgi:hypothetical protein
MGSIRKAESMGSNELREFVTQKINYPISIINKKKYESGENNG